MEKARRAEASECARNDAEKAVCAEDMLYWSDNYVWTYDPRLVGQSGGAYVPFKLWPKQREIARWLLGRIRAAEEGLIEKSRDTGVTYICAAVALHQWLFTPGFKATFGSRKVDYVDKKDNPDSIFAKLRIMLRRLPAHMLPQGFVWSQHDHYMRLVNPHTGAVISGEGGDDMGRGGRSSVYFVDEAAFVPNAETVEKALSGNTDCVIWVSSVNGMGNLFARKRHSILKSHQIARLHWRDDPRKDEDWALAKKQSLSDPTTWASEYDIDYSASVEGVCIPAAWVESARRLAAMEPRLRAGNDVMVGLDVGAGKAKSVAVVRRSVPPDFKLKPKPPTKGLTTMKTNFPGPARMAIALSTMICGSACARDPARLEAGGSKEQRVALPTAPVDFGKPVAVPARTKDARAWAVRARGAIDIANGRLRNDAKFYGDVQRDFGRH